MANPQFFLREGVPVSAPVAALSELGEDTNATAVRLEPADDARVLLPYLDRLALVEVNFPAFTDGRGYSAARILREAGYAGELRAVGDIGIDQLSHLKRCGFDAIAPAQPLDAADAAAAFARWPHVYQATGDGRAPVWALRHAK